MKTRVFSDNFNLLCQGTTSEAQLFEVVSDRTTSLAPRTIFESHLPEKVSAKIALNFHIFFPQKHLTLYSKPQLKKKSFPPTTCHAFLCRPKKKPPRGLLVVPNRLAFFRGAAMTEDGDPSSRSRWVTPGSSSVGHL